jgi:D-alanine-D-alanine ligase-like ATP-grasp enzyme
MATVVEKIVILHQGLGDSDDPMKANAVKVRDNLEFNIRELGYEPRSVYLDYKFNWVASIISLQPSLVFNVADLGFFHNNVFEPNIPAVLDGTGIPYTGSSYYSMSFSSDKFASKIYLTEFGVPVPKCALSEYFNGEGVFPAIIRYRRLHNSEGLSIDSVVANVVELERRLRASQGEQRDELIVEEYVDGPEICAGFIGNKGNRLVLPIVQFCFGQAFEGRPKIRDFESKWVIGSDGYEQSPAVIAQFDKGTTERINQYTSLIADLFGIQDYARLDYRLKPNGDGTFTPLIIDINANPDVNDDATLYKMAKHAGFSYIEYIGKIIETALERTRY